MEINEPSCEALLTLGGLSHIGNISAKTLLSYCGSAEAVLREKKSTLLKIPGVNEGIASSIVKHRKTGLAIKELDFMQRQNIRMLPYYSEDYPKRLKQISDSPLYLFVKGHMNLNSQRFLSIIGTRKNTPYGAQMVEQIVKDLKPHGINIISGLAYGIDGIAHRTCTNLNMPNCAVLAHGLDTIYPQKHFGLSEKIIATGGAIITEHISNTPMHPDLFPRRNRIVAGMSDACLVIESGAKGGSMITAGIGKKYNRTVFAVPGKKGDPMSKGCNQLIKNGEARLCETADDIIESMQWKPHVNKPPRQGELFKELGQHEQLIVELLRTKSLSFDELLVKSQIPLATLTSLLLEMEMDGFIKGLPGKQYSVGLL